MNENTTSPNRARFQRPERRQIEMRMDSLDQLVPADHRARIVRRFVESLDSTPLYERIRAVEKHAGRPPIDPRILMTLWLFATDGETRMIVSVDATNSGSDRNQMAPMQEDIKDRYGKYLVDGGFANKDDIKRVEQNDSPVIAPLHGEDGLREQGADPHARQRGDSEEMFAFRQRMAGEEAKGKAVALWHALPFNLLRTIHWQFIT